MFKKKLNLLYLLYIFMLLLPVFWISSKISISLVDDVWCSLGASFSGHDTISRYLYSLFFEVGTRFRWSYDIEQYLRWLCVGDNVGLHHVILVLYRLLIAIIAGFCVREITKNRHFFVFISPIAFALFHPIVPESRIGTQEPLMSLFLLVLLLLYVIAIRRHYNDEKKSNQLTVMRIIWIVTMIGFSGIKETGIICYFILLIASIIYQLKVRRWCIWESVILLTVGFITMWRIYSLATDGGYASTQANISNFNLGWLYWSMKMKINYILGEPNGIYWHWMLNFVVFIVGIVALVYYSILNFKKSFADLVIYATVFILWLALFVVISKLSPVARYSEPLVWLTAIVFGVGISFLIEHFNSKFTKLFVGIVIIVIPLGNYTAFLYQFVAQQLQRDAESRVIETIERYHTIDRSSFFYAFGISPYKKHAWDGFRHTEEAVMLCAYLGQYRTVYQDLEPIILRPIELINNNLNESNLLHKKYLIAIEPIEKIKEIFPKEFIVKNLGVTFHIDSNSEVATFYKKTRDIMQGLGLSKNNEHRWSDGGSPRGNIFDTRRIWGIWEIDK